MSLFIVAQQRAKKTKAPEDLRVRIEPPSKVNTLLSPTARCINKKNGDWWKQKHRCADPKGPSRDCHGVNWMGKRRENQLRTINFPPKGSASFRSLCSWSPPPDPRACAESPPSTSWSRAPRVSHTRCGRSSAKPRRRSAARFLLRVDIGQGGGEWQVANPWLSHVR